ncbi:hypothetical protein GC177_07680 [bacterium]|nr:hypothetical protein [bacterium]
MDMNAAPYTALIVDAKPTANGWKICEFGNGFNAQYQGFDALTAAQRRQSWKDVLQRFAMRTDELGEVFRPRYMDDVIQRLKDGDMDLGGYALSFADGGRVMDYFASHKAVHPLFFQQQPQLLPVQRTYPSSLRPEDADAIAAQWQNHAQVVVKMDDGSSQGAGVSLLNQAELGAFLRRWFTELPDKRLDEADEVQQGWWIDRPQVFIIQSCEHSVPVDAQGHLLPAGAAQWRDVTARIAMGATDDWELADRPHVALWRIGDYFKLPAEETLAGRDQARDQLVSSIVQGGSAPLPEALRQSAEENLLPCIRDALEEAARCDIPGLLTRCFAQGDAGNVCLGLELMEKGVLSSNAPDERWLEAHMLMESTLANLEGTVAPLRAVAALGNAIRGYRPPFSQLSEKLRERMEGWLGQHAERIVSRAIEERYFMRDVTEALTALEFLIPSVIQPEAFASLAEKASRQMLTADEAVAESVMLTLSTIQTHTPELYALLDVAEGMARTA